ncbi:hypothetical protein JGH11_17305 [Dysgonomonas sp. Marseille-P4677]|uniref:hypothetical protein n=1 Tax=Dysgonomonas sp. Marseille-P4677 TaxID=2364790 RepID=UPI0019116133|nr:hypothetical protein [Dysgonomonas sp. Marseille-P4677]MBK5722635.1 hypothetical protein [Dysgonomonas sp. Marseille-P4677]
MKRLLFFLLLLFSISTFAQENTQTNEILAQPSKGKCMVYIARRETAAMLVKFSMYDGDIFLGKLAHKKYIAYECNPGQHVFIAKGENTFYVDANLEEGKIYVMDMKVKMGVISARVSLDPLDKSHKKYEKEKKKFLEFINKKKGELLTLDEEIEDDTDNEGTLGEEGLSKRMLKFQEMKEKGKKITKITPEMFFD